MGDSAGGGFSIALAQEILKTDSLDLPRRLILISPWVDVTGGDDALQRYDTFLSNEVLRHVGADWAGELDPRDPIFTSLWRHAGTAGHRPLYGHLGSVLFGHCEKPPPTPPKGEGKLRVKGLAPSKPPRGEAS